MNERQQSHIDHYLERLEQWKGHRPTKSTARLLAARDADEAHPLRTEQEATEVVEYLRWLEQEQVAGARRKELRPDLPFTGERQFHLSNYSFESPAEN
jgi:hypothetical protein